MSHLSQANSSGESGNRTIRLETRGEHFWIILDRQEALNAFDETMLAELNRALSQVGNDGRPLILTGRGRAFSTGGDLLGYLSRLNDPAAMRHYFETAAEMLGKLTRYPGPTIAAVNGITVAGGLELVCACDLAVAARSARFADGHINYGLHPGGGSSASLAPLIGERRARWLLLSGEFIDAAEAERIGLVNRVVSDEELDAAATEMAAAVGRHCRAAIRRLKALMPKELTEVLRAERESLLEHFHEPEVRELLESFAARSKTKW